MYLFFFILLKNASLSLYTHIHVKITNTSFCQFITGQVEVPPRVLSRSLMQVCTKLTAICLVLRNVSFSFHEKKNRKESLKKMKIQKQTQFIMGDITQC